MQTQAKLKKLNQAMESIMAFPSHQMDPQWQKQGVFNSFWEHVANSLVTLCLPQHNTLLNANVLLEEPVLGAAGTSLLVSQGIFADTIDLISMSFLTSVPSMDVMSTINQQNHSSSLML